MNDERHTQNTPADLDGKTRGIPSYRAIVLDVVSLAQKVPSFPVERWVSISELADAREESGPRISWLTLFAKAYALASKDIPELRRSYIPFPWPRFHQSPYCVISCSVNRRGNGRDQLFFGRLRFPESKTLLEIQAELDRYVKGDVKQEFRQQLRCSYLPTFLRRFGWWWRANFCARQQARRQGTGSISVLAGQGVYNRLHPCMLASSLAYGPIEDGGRMWVTLQCDHRLIDGFAASEAINRIDTHLQGTVLAELRALRRADRNVA